MELRITVFGVGRIQWTSRGLDNFPLWKIVAFFRVGQTKYETTCINSSWILLINLGKSSHDCQSKSSMRITLFFTGYGISTLKSNRCLYYTLYTPQTNERYPIGSQHGTTSWAWKLTPGFRPLMLPKSLRTRHWWISCECHKWLPFWAQPLTRSLPEVLTYAPSPPSRL